MKNQGFISIISLLVMAIILISSLFLIYTSKLEYLILNSSRNNIQAYYAAESKIYMVLNNEDYYYNQLLPRMETYFKYGRIGGIYDNKIRIDNEDLISGDNNGIIKIRFFTENRRRILELKTSSSCCGITKNLVSKITMLNDFFEMQLPIVSENYITDDKLEEYEDFMNILQEKIKIPTNEKDIMGVDASDYDEIKIIKDLNDKINIEFFRNNIENPIKKEILNSKKIFLKAKNKNSKPMLVSVLSENNSDKVILDGVFYIEGEFKIYNDTEINGIIIINDGNISIKPSTELQIKGLVLLKDYIGEEIINNERIKINYDEKVIKVNGIYLPGFIEPKIQVIKSS